MLELGAYVNFGQVGAVVTATKDKKAILTMDDSTKRRVWSASMKGKTFRHGDHIFLVTAVAGKRLYLKHKAHDPVVTLRVQALGRKAYIDGHRMPWGQRQVVKAIVFRKALINAEAAAEAAKHLSLPDALYVFQGDEESTIWDPKQTVGYMKPKEMQKVNLIAVSAAEQCAIVGHSFNQPI